MIEPGAASYLPVPIVWWTWFCLKIRYLLLYCSTETVPRFLTSYSNYMHLYLCVIKPQSLGIAVHFCIYIRSEWLYWIGRLDSSVYFLPWKLLLVSSHSETDQFALDINNGKIYLTNWVISFIYYQEAMGNWKRNEKMGRAWLWHDWCLCSGKIDDGINNARVVCCRMSECYTSALGSIRLH